jgi:hypothetical protein
MATEQQSRPHSFYCTLCHKKVTYYEYGKGSKVRWGKIGFTLEDGDESISLSWASPICIDCLTRLYPGKIP